MHSQTVPTHAFSRLLAPLLAIGLSVGAQVFSAQPALSAAATDLRIRVTNVSFKVGTNGNYRVTVTNNGPAATDDLIHVLDTLPAGLSFVSGVGTGWSCSVDGQNIDCVYANSLSVGTTVALTIKVSVCTAAFPSVQNTFTLVYAGDTNTANNRVTRSTVVKNGVCAPRTPTRTRTPGTPPPTSTSGPVLTRTPTRTPIPTSTDLQLTKLVSGTFTVGSNGTYLLTVSNLGPATTAGLITVVDSLPTGLTFVSGTGTGWACSASGQNASCTTSSAVAAGTSTTITLTVAIGSAAYPTVTNTASVSYGGDTNAANNTANRPTTIRQ